MDCSIFLGPLIYITGIVFSSDLLVFWKNYSTRQKIFSVLQMSMMALMSSVSSNTTKELLIGAVLIFSAVDIFHIKKAMMPINLLKIFLILLILGLQISQRV